MYYSNQATNKAKQQITQNKTRLVTSKLIQSIVGIGETFFWKFDFVGAFHAFSYLSPILSLSLYLLIALYRVFFFCHSHSKQNIKNKQLQRQLLYQQQY